MYQPTEVSRGYDISDSHHTLPIGSVVISTINRLFLTTQSENLINTSGDVFEYRPQLYGKIYQPSGAPVTHRNFVCLFQHLHSGVYFKRIGYPKTIWYASTDDTTRPVCFSYKDLNYGEKIFRRIKKEMNPEAIIQPMWITPVADCEKVTDGLCFTPHHLEKYYDAFGEAEPVIKDLVFKDLAKEPLYG